MARLILHIGGEKTGTSYLQRFLSKNATLLRRQHHVLYPTHPQLLHQHAHCALAAAFLAPEQCDFLAPALRRTPDDLFAHINALVARTRKDTVILSAEHFSSRFELPAIRALAAKLVNYRISIVLYVRRQDELALSKFSTALKCGERGWFDLTQVTPSNRYYNPLLLIDDWASVFGADAVQVRSYASARRRGLAQDLLETAGLDSAAVASLRDVPPINEKISLTEAQVLRLINQRLPTWQEARANNAIDRYLEANQLRAELVNWLREELQDTAPVSLNSLLPAGLREQLMNRFGEVNRELVSRYGLPDADFALPTGQLSFQPQPPTDETLAKALTALGMRLLSRRKRRFSLKGSARRLAKRSALQMRKYLHPTHS